MKPKSTSSEGLGLGPTPDDTMNCVGLTALPLYGGWYFCVICLMSHVMNQVASCT